MNKSPIVVPNKEYSENQKTLQYCSIEIYEHSDDYDTDVVLGKILDYCSLKKCKYAMMFHDSDYYVENTFNKNRDLIGVKGDKKQNHWHCLIASPTRFFLNDLSLFIGIEDRWIKILKKSDDFDRMIIYLTHIRYDEKIKHHYPIENLITNIEDYAQYLYDMELQNLDNSQNNIIFHCMEILNGTKYKVKFSCVIQELTNKNHYVSELRKYWCVIKDLVNEHNLEADKKEIYNTATDLAITKSIDKTLLKLDEVDTTGFATIENNGNKYGIYKINERVKK